MLFLTQCPCAMLALVSTDPPQWEFKQFFRPSTGQMQQQLLFPIYFPFFPYASSATSLKSSSLSDHQIVRWPCRSQISFVVNSWRARTEREAFFCLNIWMLRLFHFDVTFLYSILIRGSGTAFVISSAKAHFEKQRSPLLYKLGGAQQKKTTPPTYFSNITAMNLRLTS